MPGNDIFDIVVMAKQNLQELELPMAFSGPAQLKLYTRYGDPRDAGYEQKWLTFWEIKEQFPWFPKQNICVHKHFKALLEQAFLELQNLELFSEIKTFDGGHKLRVLRGSRGVLSLHSWGAAIDMNAKQNPLGSFGTWSEGFISVMEKYSVNCGQSWNGRKDPMHFAMADG